MLSSGVSPEEFITSACDGLGSLQPRDAGQRLSLDDLLVQAFISERQKAIETLAGGSVDDQKAETVSRLKVLERLEEQGVLSVSLTITLHPDNDGYSISIKSSTAGANEAHLNYDNQQLLEYLDQREIPPQLLEFLRNSNVSPSLQDNAILAEVRDYRTYHSDAQRCERHLLLLRANAQTALTMLEMRHGQSSRPLTMDEQMNQEILAVRPFQESICLDPSPDVFKVACTLHKRKHRFNTPRLRRAIQRHLPHIRHFHEQQHLSLAAPPALRLYNLLSSRPNRHARPQYSLTLGKTPFTNVDHWKQHALKLAKLKLPVMPTDLHSIVKDTPQLKFTEESPPEPEVVEEVQLDGAVSTGQSGHCTLKVCRRPDNGLHYGQLHLEQRLQLNDTSVTYPVDSPWFEIGSKIDANKFVSQFEELYSGETQRARTAVTSTAARSKTVIVTKGTCLSSSELSTASTNSGSSKPVHNTSTPMEGVEQVKVTQFTSRPITTPHISSPLPSTAALQLSSVSTASLSTPTVSCASASGRPFAAILPANYRRGLSLTPVLSPHAVAHTSEGLVLTPAVPGVAATSGTFTVLAPMPEDFTVIQNLKSSTMSSSVTTSSSSQSAKKRSASTRKGSQSGVANTQAHNATASRTAAITSLAQGLPQMVLPPLAGGHAIVQPGSQCYRVLPPGVTVGSVMSNSASISTSTASNAPLPAPSLQAVKPSGAVPGLPHILGGQSAAANLMPTQLVKIGGLTQQQQQKLTLQQKHLRLIQQPRQQDQQQQQQSQVLRQSSAQQQAGLQHIAPSPAGAGQPHAVMRGLQRMAPLRPAQAGATHNTTSMTATANSVVRQAIGGQASSSISVLSSKHHHQQQQYQQLQKMQQLQLQQLHQLQQQQLKQQLQQQQAKQAATPQQEQQQKQQQAQLEQQRQIVQGPAAQHSTQLQLQSRNPARPGQTEGTVQVTLQVERQSPLIVAETDKQGLPPGSQVVLQQVAKLQSASVEPQLKPNQSEETMEGGRGEQYCKLPVQEQTGISATVLQEGSALNQKPGGSRGRGRRVEQATPPQSRPRGPPRQAQLAAQEAIRRTHI